MHGHERGISKEMIDFVTALVKDEHELSCLRHNLTKQLHDIAVAQHR